MKTEALHDIGTTSRALRHTSLVPLLLALALAMAGVGCDNQEDAPAADPDAQSESDSIQDDAAEPGRPPIDSLPPAEQLLALATEPVPWTDPGEVAISIFDARLSLHAIQAGPVLDLGEASAVTAIQGHWRAPWLTPERISKEDAEKADLAYLAERALVWNEGSAASIRFPVPDDLQQDVPYTLLVRLRPKSPIRRVQINLNEHKNIKTVDLTGEWETIAVSVNPKQITFGGENTLSFVFAGSYYEGKKRVAARFDDVRLLPTSEDGAWRNTPPPGDIGVPDARILTTDRRALGIAAPSRHDAYVVLPEHPRLRVFVGPAPFTQTSTRAIISVQSDTIPKRVLFDEMVAPGGPWKPIEADLADFAGQAVRLSFAAEPGPQGPTGNVPAIYMGEPVIVIVRPPAPPVTALAPASGPTRVVIVAVDALRADRINPDGPAGHPATPTITRLANEGVRMEAIAQGAGTVVPTTSVLTGTYGPTHGVFDTVTHVRTSLTTIGEVFDEAGWETGFLSTDPYITLDRGFAQGFDRYRNLVEEQGPARTSLLIDGAIRILKKKSTRNRMLYVQIGGLRLPHQPSSEALEHFYTGAYTGQVSVQTMLNPVVLTNLNEEDKRYLNAVYDAEMLEIDAHISRLMQTLSETGEMKDTLVVVMGLHGEPLGEDPELGYNNRLSDAELRVPMVFWWPAGIPAGVLPAQRGELVDVMPTVLDLAGLVIPDEVQGESLRAVLDGKTDNSAAPGFSARADTHRSVSQGRYHYLLRSGDRDLLFDRTPTEGLATDDRRETMPIAHRALRDSLALHLRWVEKWRKSVWGSPASPRSAFAEMAWERGW